MGWPAIGEAEAAAIAGTVVRNLHVRLAADRERAPVTGLPLRPAADRAARRLRRAGRARRRLRGGRVRQPRAGDRRHPRRGRAAPGRPGRPPARSSPARSAPTPRSRWPRPRPPATRPRPSSPTCARAAARRRSPSPRPRSRRPACACARPSARPRGRRRWPSAGVVPQADLETVLANRDTAQTEVAQLEAELDVQRLPARVQVVAAAESQLAGTEAAVRDARWRLEQRDLVAPAAGEVTDVFRRVGEIAGPTAPVLSLLPDGAWKLVVFVGETEVAGIAPGRPARRALRRLPAGADRHRLLRLRRARVHPAGHLLRREPPEARLPRSRRGPPRTARASGPDRSSMSSRAR